MMALHECSMDALKFALIPCYPCTHACVDTAIHTSMNSSMHPSPSKSDTTPFLPIPCHTIPFVFACEHMCLPAHRPADSPLSAHGSIPSSLRSFHMILSYPLVVFKTACLSLNCALTTVGEVFAGLARNIKCQLYPCYQ